MSLHGNSYNLSMEAFLIILVRKVKKLTKLEKYCCLKKIIMIRCLQFSVIQAEYYKR